MLTYLVESGAWSLGGLVVGYFLGRIDARLRHIEKLEERAGSTHDDT
jgi:hypothetical protein